LGHEEAESESLLLGRDERLLLGHEKTELEGVLLDRGGISDLGVSVPSENFYSTTMVPPTRP